MKLGSFVIPLLAVVSVALAQVPGSNPQTEGNDNAQTQAPANPTSNTPIPGSAESAPPAPDQSKGAEITTTGISSAVPSQTAVNGDSASSSAPAATVTNVQSTAVGGSGGNSKVLTGLTALFAILFAIALAGAIFFFVKRRQDRRKAYLSPEYSSPEAAYSDKSANAQIESLQNQLSDANKRLTAVQGSLLAAGQKPQTKDDNSLSREYTQLGTDIVGWAGNYFKSSTDPINLTTELYEFLTEHVPSYQSLLSNGKSKQLVVRAIVSQVLQESFENGAFFGNAMSAITPLIRTSTAPAPAINSWRSETFFILEKSDDFSSQRRAAVSAIADKIEQLTYPLAATKQTLQGDPARYKFLEGIIRKAADFALALGKQRANFQVLSEPAGCEFGHATMDDVSQQTDITTNSDGSTTHPLESRPIQATIFPLFLKYGNESGEGYEQITILSKAKVLV
ncbi:hypothetical protein H072_10446 [Dactylellina haptotyla CBS 200.50]|uniref:Uncharacterized protein n=1 Tax=Dactylellina haptotyla (strain CBS 200.50) TaxID=1284197 RepID=S7ZZB1_DACHA|nr:hypothetical protein H072_10446 [Dactylellina haptotyla CBS 200.50]